MASKILIYAGAPESHALNWQSDGLLSDFQEPIAQFAAVGRRKRPGEDATTIKSSAAEYPAWRSLSLEKGQLHTGFSQPNSFGYEFGRPGSQLVAAPDFFNTASLGASGGVEWDDHEGGGGQGQRELLSQFYEHSLAIHEGESPSSQLLLPCSAVQSQATDPGDEATSFLTNNDETTTSFLSGYAGDNTTTYLDNGDTTTMNNEEEDTTIPPGPAREPLRFHGAGAQHQHLSDLEDIPSAAYLTKIQPQTVTCNLIVGIISISPPRTIKTRWGTEQQLVEVLVGDETKAGFAITFWLPSGSSSSATRQTRREAAESEKNSSRNVLEGLRNRDVVLIQNVALNVFSKKVYGSSLRGNYTKVHLMYRARLDAEDVGGYYGPSDVSLSRRGESIRGASDGSAMSHPQLDKTRRVWDWVLRFVGGGYGGIDEEEEDGGKETRKRKGKGKATASTTRNVRPRRAWDNRPPLDDTQEL